MMLRLLNVASLLMVTYTAFLLINKRYEARQNYTKLSDIKQHVGALNQEYSRLLIEEGTYNSNLVLQSVATKKLGLRIPDKKHIMEVK